MERLARANELIISGVPRIENENIIKICDSICGAIGFNGNNNIDSCFRMPLKSNNSSSNNSNRQFSPSIIIKFWSSDAKTEFFKSYISKKNLCYQYRTFYAWTNIHQQSSLRRTSKFIVWLVN